VGQLGLEQLDARVVPSATPVGGVLGGPPQHVISPPTPPQHKPDVQLDEYGGAQNAAVVTSLSNSEQAALKDALKDNGVKGIDFNKDGTIKGGGLIYQLNKDINLNLGKDGIAVVKVTEGGQVSYSYSDTSNPSNKNLSDLLIFQTINVKNQYGRGYTQETLVLVFSAKEQGKNGSNAPADVNRLPDVGGVNKRDVITTPEQNEQANFKVDDVQVTFFSEGHVKPTKGGNGYN